MKKFIGTTILLGLTGNLAASAHECRNPTWENEKQETSMDAHNKQNLMKIPDNDFASLMIHTLMVLSISVLAKWYLKERNFNLFLKVLIDRFEKDSDALNRLLHVMDMIVEAHEDILTECNFLELHSIAICPDIIKRAGSILTLWRSANDNLMQCYILNGRIEQDWSMLLFPLFPFSKRKRFKLFYTNPALRPVLRLITKHLESKHAMFWEKYREELRLSKSNKKSYKNVVSEFENFYKNEKPNSDDAKDLLRFFDEYKSFDRHPYELY